MEPRTPVTLITGPLGSGKTTLLRHLLEVVPQKIAIMMNEFGEIAIDSQIVEGKNIRIAELEGGCVCCSLLGEFEAAVTEVIDTVHPDLIIVETTGVAEPDAVMFDIQENLPQVRLDGVVTVADADAMVRYPRLGQTGRAQIEAADIIVLNKVDLVPAEPVAEITARLRQLNADAPILPTQRCQVDPDVLFGISQAHEVGPPQHRHQFGMESFSYVSAATLERRCFEAFVEGLSPAIVRAKGFVRFPEGTYLFNYVAGRWDLEAFSEKPTTLVFIGEHVTRHQADLIDAIQQCEQ
ncbi:MAG: CobW family GTP-binding protein [Candidatus Entotheonellia bacterium]